jgi:hypothetical protein
LNKQVFAVIIVYRLDGEARVRDNPLNGRDRSIGDDMRARSFWHGEQ